MASYEKLKSGWSVRFRVIERGKEVNKRLSGFKLKNEATKAYMNYVATALTKKEINIDYANYTFGELFEDYLESILNTVRESTYLDYRQGINKHFLGEYQSYKVTKIKDIHILKWQNKLKADGYAVKYINKLRGILNGIWKVALEKKICIVNPVKGVRPLKADKPPKEMKFLTLEEFNKFLSVIDNEVHKTLFVMLFYTGMRKGELLALKWRDYDGKNIRINKSITNRTFSGEYESGLPKNWSSIRTMALPPVAREQLDRLKKQTKGARNDFIFEGRRKGNIIPFQTLANIKNRYCEKAEIKNIRIHDFRHSHASLLIRGGANIALVARRLGHKDAAVTLNTYTHISPPDEIAILDTFR